MAASPRVSHALSAHKFIYTSSACARVFVAFSLSRFGALRVHSTHECECTGPTCYCVLSSTSSQCFLLCSSAAHSTPRGRALVPYIYRLIYTPIVDPVDIVFRTARPHSTQAPAEPTVSCWCTCCTLAGALKHTYDTLCISLNQISPLYISCIRTSLAVSSLYRPCSASTPYSRERVSALPV